MENSNGKKLRANRQLAIACVLLLACQLAPTTSHAAYFRDLAKRCASKDAAVGVLKNVMGKAETACSTMTKALEKECKAPPAPPRPTTKAPHRPTPKAPHPPTTKAPPPECPPEHEIRIEESEHGELTIKIGMEGEVEHGASFTHGAASPTTTTTPPSCDDTITIERSGSGEMSIKIDVEEQPPAAPSRKIFQETLNTMITVNDKLSRVDKALRMDEVDLKKVGFLMAEAGKATLSMSIDVIESAGVVEEFEFLSSTLNEFVTMKSEGMFETEEMFAESIVQSSKLVALCDKFSIKFEVIE